MLCHVKVFTFFRIMLGIFVVAISSLGLRPACSKDKIPLDRDRARAIAAWRERADRCEQEAEGLLACLSQGKQKKTSVPTVSCESRNGEFVGDIQLSPTCKIQTLWFCSLICVSCSRHSRLIDCSSDCRSITYIRRLKAKEIRQVIQVLREAHLKQRVNQALEARLEWPLWYLERVWLREMLVGGGFLKEGLGTGLRVDKCRGDAVLLTLQSGSRYRLRLRESTREVTISRVERCSAGDCLFSVSLSADDFDAFRELLAENDASHSGGQSAEGDEKDEDGD